MCRIFRFALPQKEKKSAGHVPEIISLDTARRTLLAWNRGAHTLFFMPVAVMRLYAHAPLLPVAVQDIFLFLFTL